MNEAWEKESLTVAELIAVLQALPEHKRVWAEGDSGLYAVAVSEHRNPTYPEDETYVVIHPA
jgi:hypothetical protein